MIEPEDLMRRAIEKAAAGMRVGQSPFGCAVATSQNVVAVTHNTVLATTDITAHAEINAIREACRQTGEIHLTDCIVATTCEPCPMCLAALHWARVRVVYYGATIGDATAAGFNELQLPAHELLAAGGSHVKIVPNVLVDECRSLFQQWLERRDRQVY